MNKPDLGSMPKTFNVTFADASHLPIHHVNAMGIRGGSDEFFFTIGIVEPPDQEQMAAVIEAGHVEAQPILRFAISRDTMEKFLALMAGQYDQQTRARNLLENQSREKREEE